jgi:hypothetical protein
MSCVYSWYKFNSAHFWITFLHDNVTYSSRTLLLAACEMSFNAFHKRVIDCRANNYSRYGVQQFLYTVNVDVTVSNKDTMKTIIFGPGKSQEHNNHSLVAANCLKQDVRHLHDLIQISPYSIFIQLVLILNSIVSSMSLYSFLPFFNFHYALRNPRTFHYFVIFTIIPAFPSSAFFNF